MSYVEEQEELKRRFVQECTHNIYTYVCVCVWIKHLVCQYIAGHTIMTIYAVCNGKLVYKPTSYFFSSS